MSDQATGAAMLAAPIGLGASIATAIDDLGPAATFCAETGCELVRASGWARPLGIPMSLLGVLFFGAMCVLAFLPKHQRLRLWLSLAGGAWGVFLLVLQGAVIGEWCKLCLVADLSAIALAVCVFFGAKAFGVNAVRVGIMAGLAGLTFGAIVAITSGSKAKPTGGGGGGGNEVVDQTPQFVKDAQDANAVTIVEVLDFECPFCRQMNKRIEDAKARTKVPVKIVRKMLPLPMHPGAVPAAIAWVCADMQGKGEEMAKVLFESDPSQFTAAGCQRMAKEIGCDIDQFLKDVDAAVKRVQGDMALLKAEKISKLPTFFIGTDKHVGAALDVDQLVAEIEKHAP